MNFFTYTTKSAYISNLKWVKDIEEELRNLKSQVATSACNPNPKGTDAVIRPFMLYSQCYKLLRSKSNKQLPDFLYHTLVHGAIILIDYIIKYKPEPLTYEEYIDIFKDFTPQITLPSSNISYELGITSGMGSLVYIAKVVGDNLNPYPLDYSNVYSSELYSNVVHSNKNAKLTLQAIALRKFILNDKRYTVLEDFIAHHSTQGYNKNATLEAKQLYESCIELDQLTGNNGNN